MGALPCGALELYKMGICGKILRRRICCAVQAARLLLRLLLLILPLPAAASGLHCATSIERAAFEMRMLQTELMVAALACRGSGRRDFAGDYAVFVARHRASLKSHADLLRNLFRNRFGVGSETHLDRYVTALANGYSQASSGGSPAFCARFDMVFAHATSVTAADLGRFAAERATIAPPGISACTAPGQMADGR